MAIERKQCDVCLQGVSRPDGYLLTTSQVVASPEYWRAYYELHAAECSKLGIDTFDSFCRAQPALGTGPTIAAMPTPWLVCDKCISYFSADRDEAREHAKQWWQSWKWWRMRCTYEPPGNGHAPLAAIDMGDGKRWQAAMDFLQNPKP